MYKTHKQNVNLRISRYIKNRQKRLAFVTSAFALPTVLIASVVLLTVLVAAISTTTAISSQLRERNYLRHAGLAAEAGEAFKKACLVEHAGSVTWSDSKPLRPNTDCSGTVDPDKSAYVLDVQDEGFRTYFVVDSSLRAKGYTEALRTSTGIAWRVWTDTASAQQVSIDGNPVGTFIEGAWTNAPAGYLLADGSAVSRTTYAKLFAVIGTTYGAGNGSTTFNLPDARGRVLVQKSTDTEFDALGEKGGEKTHILNIAEMPVHNHPLKLEGAASNAAGDNPNIGDDIRIVYGADGSGGTMNDGLQRSVDTSGTSGYGPLGVQNRGGGGAHNNIQPYITVNRAIKY